ncbi:MAG: hypothetical protein N2487_05080 [Verrucomicrobiae bacterium]|nr:hypothetical protein [Verrucomicrobiae bacterium]
MHNFTLIVLAICIFALGCKREEVRVYQIPKESAPVAMPHSQLPEWKVTGKTPSNWEPRPSSGMRVAQYLVKGKEGAQGEVVVMPMAGMKASRDEILAIWRQQFGPDVKEKSEKVKIGDDEGELYDFSTDQPQGNEIPQRILVAMLFKDNVNWFFRISGSKDLVGESRNDFIAYLNSVKFEQSNPGNSSESPTNPHQAQPSQVAPHQPAQTQATTQMPIELPVPDDWKQQPPAPMAPLRYEVSSGSATAMITITRLDGDGGGLLANINRWRGQIKLPPVSPEDVDKQVSRVKTAVGEALVVDFFGTNTANNPTRVVGIIAPAGSYTWFFKMTGQEQAVNARKDELIKYVQSFKF